MFEARYEAKHFKLPELAIERSFDVEVVEHVTQSFPPGVYTDATVIDQICKAVIQFCRARITQLMTEIASEKYLVHLLSLWESMAPVQDDSIDGKLDKGDAAIWAIRGRSLRRATKYLSQQCILSAPKFLLTPRLSKSEYDKKFDQLLIAAEHLVQYSFAVEQTRLYFSDSTELLVTSSAIPEISISDVQLSNRILQFNNLEKKHAALREQLIGHLFEDNFKLHQPILNDAFKKEFGLTYQEVQDCILMIAWRQGNVQQVQGATRAKVFKALSQSMCINASRFKRVLSAFVLTKQDMETEEQSYFDPKARFRPFRRGVFEYEANGGEYWVWSVRMAWESAAELFRGLVYKQVPAEWKSDVINLAVERLSAEGSKWFETLVRQQLIDHGIVGSSFKSQIGTGDSRVDIPAEVGELDFLGYSEHSKQLVLVECKMVQMATDPKMWRRDNSEFITRTKNSYASKFRRKIEFVRNNRVGVIKALGHDCSEDDHDLGVAMVTLYPSLVSAFITDFPCLSVTELIEKLEQSKCWPTDLLVVKDTSKLA